MDTRGNTPLHIAVDEDMLSCVQELLSVNVTTTSKGATKAIVDVNVFNDESLTPILIAIERKNFKVVKLLFAGGAMSRLREPKNGNNVLHRAVEMNWFDLVYYILRKRYVNVNEKNSSDFTALDLAIAQQPKSSDVVKLLLTYHALATVDPDEDNETALIKTSSSTKCTAPIATTVEMPVAAAEPSIVVVGVQFSTSNLVIKNTVSTQIVVPLRLC